MNVNAMGSPVAAPGDILAIPLPGMIDLLIFFFYVLHIT
jgi:hypothetical protein